MEIVNIGLIGCGEMAAELARACVKLGRARISVVSDPSAKARSAAAIEFGAAEAGDADALCAHADVDAVLIASPPGAHRENVLSAARCGKPIYCEKPLGVSVGECDEMIAACRQAGVPLFVGQVLRLFPLFWRSRTLIDEGLIGAPRAVSITRSGYPEIFHSGWRTSRSLAGGMLLETNVHEFDYLRFLLGEPKTVYARLHNIFGAMEYEDQASVLIDFENAATGCLHASFSSPIGSYRVEIQGTGGNIVHTGARGALDYRTRDGQTGQVRAEDVGTADPYVWELTSWLDSLTLGAAPLFTGDDGRAAVAMAEAAMRSSEQNRPIAIKELDI